MITEVYLNHPFAYVCKDKAKKKKEFQRQYSGGNEWTTLELGDYLKEFPRLVNKAAAMV